MKQVIFSSVFLLFTTFSFAQNTGNEAGRLSIFKQLETPDSVTLSTVKVFQDNRIELLFFNRGNALFTNTIYRVQVFSSNVQRTAKAEAFNLERQLREKYPSEAVHVTYPAPFWKVRIGEFRTREAAQRFRAEVAKDFPGIRNEIYVVPEQPN